MTLHGYEIPVSLHDQWKHNEIGRIRSPTIICFLGDAWLHQPAYVSYFFDMTLGAINCHTVSGSAESIRYWEDWFPGIGVHKRDRSLWVVVRNGTLSSPPGWKPHATSSCEHHRINPFGQQFHVTIYTQQGV